MGAIEVTRAGAEAAPVDLAERVRELEHLLELERARRQAVEQGLERMTERVTELVRENAELRG
jgi:hypothetical protein